MRQLIEGLLLATVVAALVIASGATEPLTLSRNTKSRFQPGQVWTYRTRPGEERSRIIIGRVDVTTRLGTIVHIKVVGVSVKNPQSPKGISTEISHVPMLEAALATSVKKRVQEEFSLDGFDAGYRAWRESWDRGKGAAFSEPIAVVIGLVEETLNR